MYIQFSIYMYIYIYVYVYVSDMVYICICMHVCMYVCVCEFSFIRVVCGFVYVCCIYVCVYFCIWVFTFYISMYICRSCWFVGSCAYAKWSPWLSPLIVRGPPGFLLLALLSPDQLRSFELPSVENGSGSGGAGCSDMAVAADVVAVVSIS